MFLFQILTKDSVTVYVNAIMYYKVNDAISAVTNVDDYSGSARLLAATTLRNVLGTKNLGDVLSERESIANEMQVRCHANTHMIISPRLEPWRVLSLLPILEAVRGLSLLPILEVVRGLSLLPMR